LYENKYFKLFQTSTTLPVLIEAPKSLDKSAGFVDVLQATVGFDSSSASGLIAAVVILSLLLAGLFVCLLTCLKVIRYLCWHF